MTDQPIKVTDEILDDISWAIDSTYIDPTTSMGPIYELRDRARAVIEARIAPRKDAIIMPLELCMALDKLMEVLP